MVGGCMVIATSPDKRTKQQEKHQHIKPISGSMAKLKSTIFGMHYMKLIDNQICFNSHSVYLSISVHFIPTLSNYTVIYSNIYRKSDENLPIFTKTLTISFKKTSNYSENSCINPKKT